MAIADNWSPCIKCEREVVVPITLLYPYDVHEAIWHSLNGLIQHHGIIFFTKYSYMIENLLIWWIGQMKVFKALIVPV